MNGATLMIHAFDMMRQHIKPGARVHGIITNGGSANNVIPDFSAAEYCARYPDSEYLKHIAELMHDCARGAAIATQTELEVTQIGRTLDNMRQNASGETLLEEVYEELGVPVVVESDENIGSSDIGNVSHRCAAFHPYLSVSDEFIPLHTKELAAKMKEKGIEKRIALGVKIISLAILRAVFEPQTLEAIRKEFRESK